MRYGRRPMSTTPDAVATFHLAAALRRYAADVSTLAPLTSAALEPHRVHVGGAHAGTAALGAVPGPRGCPARARPGCSDRDPPPPGALGPAHPLWPVPRRPGVWRLRRPSPIPPIRAPWAASLRRCARGSASGSRPRWTRSLCASSASSALASSCSRWRCWCARGAHPPLTSHRCAVPVSSPA